MTQPSPLVPADVDLSDFPFMPLDVARLRDSDLAANESPEACWAAVLLWAASWHQVPAASVPDDDKWLAKHTGYGRVIKEWLRIREGALRGWLICSDGRLYHPVVAEKALEAWQAKLLQRWRTECARIKKHNQRHETDLPLPSYEEWLSLGRPAGQPLPVPRDSKAGPEDTGRDKPSKGQGEGQRQGDSLNTSEPNGSGASPPVSAEAMTKQELWASGKSLLEAQGMPKAQCGSFVGKLVKDYGDAVVIDAVRAAVVQRPADAAEWLVGACKKGAKPVPSITVPSDAAERTRRELDAKELTPEEKSRADAARLAIFGSVKTISQEAA